MVAERKGVQQFDRLADGYLQGACENDEPVGCKGVHNANNQLCGATYVEMAMAGMAGKEALAPTEKVFMEEIAAPSSSNFWSWVRRRWRAAPPWHGGS